MDFNFEGYFSSSANMMKKSVIRELLKLTSKPEIISFAGGLPAPETFPVDDLKPIVTDLIDKDGATILQYGATEGDPDLKKMLIERFKKQTGMTNLNENNILVVSASQQALDVVAKVFLDPGDKIIVERPSYLGGLSAFNAYKANSVGIRLENDGMNVDELEDTLKSIYQKGEIIKFIYVIPDFQNPGGFTYSLEKRKKIVELSRKYKFIIIEDSPYRELRYTGKEEPTLFSIAGGENVVALYTFSKIFCPGLRLGWIIAPEPIIQKFVIAKQAMDLCTPPFTQAIAAEYMKRGLLEERIRKNIELYSGKRDYMLQCLEKYMKKEWGVSWTEPEGGLFLWVTLPEYMNADEMFYKAVENNVAFVIGSAFYADYPEKNHFRMNFSYPSLENIEEGVKRLAKVIEKALK